MFKVNRTARLTNLEHNTNYAIITPSFEVNKLI